MKTQAIKSKKFAAEFKDYLHSIENLVRLDEVIIDNTDKMGVFVEEMFSATNIYTINERLMTNNINALANIENVSTRMAKEAKRMTKMVKSARKKMKKMNLSEIQAAELVAEQAQHGKLEKERMKAEKKAAKKAQSKADKKAAKMAGKKTGTEVILPRPETTTTSELLVQARPEVALAT